MQQLLHPSSEPRALRRERFIICSFRARPCVIEAPSLAAALAIARIRSIEAGLTAEEAEDPDDTWAEPYGDGWMAFQLNLTDEE